MSIKNEIIDNLEDRIKRLDEHLSKDNEYNDNEFKNLNCALSNVLGATLKKEIEDIIDFVEHLN